MPKRLISASAFLVAFTPLLVRTSWGWNETGHKVVALIAWEDLTPKTRAAVVELLTHHPRYEKDLLTGVPESPDAAGATGAAGADETASHAFAVASTWPDMVRGQGHPMHAAYSHPQWHYINIPFEDGAPATPASERAPAEPGPANIVEALEQCTRELKDPATPPEQKAIDICWIAHLVGDIHQPLHAATRYSPQFPHGDTGGNSAMVLRDPPFPNSEANLHFVWDSLAGTFRAESIDRYLATGLRADPAHSRERLIPAGQSPTDFAAWARDSHALAVEHVYLNGKLEVAAGRKGGPTTQPAPGLPPGYVKDAERIAMTRIATAGYRLADVLNSILDPKP
jgi:hypothetical protein